MSRLLILAVTAWVVLGLALSRVLVDPPKQDHPSIDQLLQQSDPLENDIFSESVSRRVSATPRAAPRPSPTQHLLESLSPPKYVDASEFRRLEVLPPALDINRQLTLLSASRRIRPPVGFVHPILSEESSDTVFFPNTSPLFREDFPAQKIVVEQNKQEETSVVDKQEETSVVDKQEETSVVDNKQEETSIVEESTQRVDEAIVDPTISTSVSVSTSMSFSNNSSTILDSETSSDASATDAPIAASSIFTTLQAESSSNTTPSTTRTTTSTSSPSEVSQSYTVSDNASDTSRSSTQVVEAEIILHPEGSDYPQRSGRQLTYDVGADFPDYPDYSDYEAMSPLSPLAHILGGLGSEFDSYGGDFGRSEFISGFRPDEF